MDIFDKYVHLCNNTFINTIVQPFYIDNILKEYYINISWKAGKRGQIEDMIKLCHDILFIIVQFPTKIASSLNQFTHSLYWFKICVCVYLVILIDF
jgi:hypothetical protein